MKLLEIQTLVWPRAIKTLNTKTANFWYICYILILEKDQELKIAEAKYTIVMYTLSNIQPHSHYILGDMIPPSYGSILFRFAQLEEIYISIQSDLKDSKFWKLGFLWQTLD